MHTVARRLPVVASTLLAAVALPCAALAQQQLAPVRVTASVIAHADSLDARADSHPVATLRDMPKVASLRERSAELRTDADPKRFAGFQTAAFLRYGAGDRRRALADMELAARSAAARGDVENAANAYIHAAHLALDLRQTARVVEYTNAARLLAESPLLTEEQRIVLRGRLPHETQVAQR